MKKISNKKRAHGDVVRKKIMKFLIDNQVLISPVSLQEIGDAVGKTSLSVVKYHLEILEREGMIRHAHKVRGIFVLDERTAE